MSDPNDLDQDQRPRSSTFSNGTVRLTDLRRKDEDGSNSPSSSRSSSVNRGTTDQLSPLRKNFDRESIGSRESINSRGSDGTGHHHQSKISKAFDKAKNLFKKKHHDGEHVDGIPDEDDEFQSNASDPVITLRQANNAIVMTASTPIPPVLAAAVSSANQQAWNPKLSELVPKQETRSETARRLARLARTMPFFKQRMVLLALLFSMAIAFPGFLTGFLWGTYLCFIGFLYWFVSEPMTQKDWAQIRAEQESKVVHQEIERIAKTKNVVYKGWMNELRGRYSPSAFHINDANSVLIRLDGNFLRISRPARRVLKHAFHIDPTLTDPEPTMTGQSIYDLTDANIALRPTRLAARRWWSRKYPLRIRLASRKSEITRTDATITGYGLHRSQSAQNNIAQLARERREAAARRQSTSSGKQQNGDIDETAVEALKAKEQDLRLRNDDAFDSDYSEVDELQDGDAQSQSTMTRSYSVNEMQEFVGNQCLDPKLRMRQMKTGRSIYLFARSTREKERWFHRIREACARYRSFHSTDDRSLHAQQMKVGSENKSSLERSVSISTMPTDHIRISSPNPAAMNLEYFHYLSTNIQFGKVMAEILKPAVADLLERGGKVAVEEEAGKVVLMDLGRLKWHPTAPTFVSGQGGTSSPSLGDKATLLGINAVLSRIFFDFCRDSFWVKQIRNKVQAKIAAVHLPYFIDGLEISHIDLGTTPPQIVGFHAPTLDEWGVWLDVELRYAGGIRIGLETRVDLMKLKTGAQGVAANQLKERLTDSVRGVHYDDDDLPESPESSADEDFGAKAKPGEEGKEKTGKKVLKVVDRFTQSKFFDKITNLGPLRKAMENFSSTRLMLNVEVTGMEGTLAINIPPPPSDRLWYGFRGVPNITLHAVPVVGDRTVDLTSVSDWIEGRMHRLIENFLVMPNMDDIVVPLMTGNVMLKATPYNL